MISPRADTSLQNMVTRALQGSPLVPSGGVLEITRVQEVAEAEGSQIVALTVMSYSFRLMLLLRFGTDAQTRNHFAQANRVDPAEFDDHRFMDAVRECGNVCCGNLNRDLVQVFAHVGMSTPNMVDRRCMDYLDKLGAGLIQHFAMVTGAGVRFHVTVCVNEFEDLDFEDTAVVAEDSGELELF